MKQGTATIGAMRCQYQGRHHPRLILVQTFTSWQASMGVLAKDLSMTQLLAPSSQRLVLLELRGVYPVVDLPPRK